MIKYILLLVLVAGCTVSSEDAHKAIDYCESHGGLEYIASAGTSTHAHCINGVVVIIL